MLVHLNQQHVFLLYQSSRIYFLDSSDVKGALDNHHVVYQVRGQLHADHDSALVPVWPIDLVSTFLKAPLAGARGHGFYLDMPTWRTG